MRVRVCVCVTWAGVSRSQALVDGVMARARGHVRFGFPVNDEALIEHLYKTIGSDHYPIIVTVDVV